MNSIMAAVIYAVVAIIVVPLGFAVFKTQHQFLDVVLAGVGGAACSLIPTAGGTQYFAGLLHARTGSVLCVPFGDFIVSTHLADSVCQIARTTLR